MDRRPERREVAETFLAGLSPESLYSTRNGRALQKHFFAPLRALQRALHAAFGVPHSNSTRFAALHRRYASRTLSGCFARLGSDAQSSCSPDFLRLNTGSQGALTSRHHSLVRHRDSSSAASPSLHTGWCRNVGRIPANIPPAGSVHEWAAHTDLDSSRWVRPMFLHSGILLSSA